jgi:hypothetical protein
LQQREQRADGEKRRKGKCSAGGDATVASEDDHAGECGEDESGGECAGRVAVETQDDEERELDVAHAERR